MLNTCSIGRRWKSREGWSRPVLTGERGTLFPIPLGDWVSSCGGFLVGWQGTLFLVVTTTILVKRLICLRPLSGSRTATTGIGRVAGSVAGRSVWLAVHSGFAVVMAQVRRPVPFRTRKLRPGTAMVLHSRGCGRVARRRILSLGVPVELRLWEPLFFCFSSGFFWPSRTSRQRLSGSSKVFFRGLRPSRSSGPPGRASMTSRRVLLLSGAYRRTRVAGDPFSLMTVRIGWLDAARSWMPRYFRMLSKTSSTLSRYSFLPM